MGVIIILFFPGDLRLSERLPSSPRSGSWVMTASGCGGSLPLPAGQHCVLRRGLGLPARTTSHGRCETSHGVVTAGRGSHHKHQV